MSTKLSRRGVVKVSLLGGAALVLGASVPFTLKSNKPKASSAEPNVFVTISSDGLVTITVPKPDIGQGVRTSLAMLVAEELDADWTKVKVVQAQADEKYGGQGVGGSGSIRQTFRPLRQAGATARAMMVAAAAKKFGVSAEQCTVANGVVRSGSKKATFGELVSEAASIAVPGEVTLKSPEQFTLIGKPVRRVDNPNVVTGKAAFGIDARVPGMKFAVLARPSVFGGRLDSFDLEAAKKVPGVVQVLEMGRSVLIVANNTWAAFQGRKALNAKETKTDLNQEGIRKQLIEALPTHELTGDTVSAEYELPFLAHATMEPMNCTVHFKGDAVEVWAPTQAPEGTRAAVARASGLSQDKVTVNVTLIGGGFGRRFQMDFIEEAVQAAKLAGVPLQLVWSRDDDMQHDFYRPSTHHSFKGTVADGKVTAWSHNMAQCGGRGRPGRRNAGLPYEIENATMASGNVQTPVPLGAWRSVENTFLGFANESFMDELAHAAKEDPLRFRIKHCRNERLKECLEQVAEKSNWTTKLPAGSGRGVAVFQGYGSFIAQVVEVTVKNNRIKVNRVVSVVDCGLAINPLGVDAQVQGAVIDALSTTLKAGITIEGGAVAQKGWSDYDWFRMDEMPKLETHIIPSAEAPGGMGEVGYPAVPAALANAIFAACGKRLRKLPTGFQV